MSTLAKSAGGSLWREAAAFLSDRLTQIDRPAWRRFFLALFGLGLAFLLAVFSAALNQSGRHGWGVLAAALSLVLAGIVAVKVVPYLAKRTALERWLEKIEFEFTREGVVYFLVIAVIVVAALNTGNNLLFIVLASLLAGILASGILSMIVLERLELDFLLPEHVFAARPVVSRLTVRNLKWLLPSFSLTVATRRGGQSAMKKGEAASLPSAPRQSEGGILNETVYLPYIPRRASVTQHVELRFRRRGRYTQEGFSVSSKFPFGFLMKTRAVIARQEILVLPSVEPTEEFYEILPLVSGEVESFYKGRGHDLYAIRDYQEGDTARHLDWKASAKAQQLKVREFTREDERRVVLVFDPHLADSDAITLAKFEKAVNLCACLVWHFFEIDAQMQFLTEGFETRMASAPEVVYPALESLALIEARADGRSTQALFAQASAVRGFNIILTSQPRGSIPTSLWGTSYLIFIDSL
ncbi:MAG: hypothetical protein DMG22_12370 [Acidobacteria bacterium]|nr:MAG: hypothetical protein DMG22_12370 [Acidobacteriota bacterium]